MWLRTASRLVFVKAEHHKGSYDGRARLVRAAAMADPATLCWRCGQPRRLGDPWTAGHVIDGEINGVLLPEHASCNFKAGARHGNLRRLERRSREW